MVRTTVHQERKALEQEGCRVPNYISLDKFRKAWVRYFGPPVLASDRYFLEVGIRSFWEDYLTGEPQPVRSYLACCEA